MMKTAFFVYRPRRLADLRRPHSLEEEKPYHVSGIVILSDIDYENFTEDLLADRAFLERARKADGCLLVKTRRQKDGLLVYWEKDRVTWAAYYPGE